MKLLFIQILFLLIILSTEVKIKKKSYSTIIDALNKNENFKSRFYIEKCHVYKKKEDCLKKLMVDGLWGNVKHCAWISNTFCGEYSKLISAEENSIIELNPIYKEHIEIINLKKEIDKEMPKINKPNFGVILEYFDFSFRNFQGESYLNGRQPHYIRKENRIDLDSKDDFSPFSQFAIRFTSFLQIKYEGM